MTLETKSYLIMIKIYIHLLEGKPPEFKFRPILLVAGEVISEGIQSSRELKLQVLYFPSLKLTPL